MKKVKVFIDYSPRSSLKIEATIVNVYKLL